MPLAISAFVVLALEVRHSALVVLALGLVHAVHRSIVEVANELVLVIPPLCFESALTEVEADPRSDSHDRDHNDDGEVARAPALRARACLVPDERRHGPTTLPNGFSDSKAATGAP